MSDILVVAKGCIPPNDNEFRLTKVQWCDDSTTTEECAIHRKVDEMVYVVGKSDLLIGVSTLATNALCDALLTTNKHD